MPIEKDIQKLVALERDVRTLDALIQHIRSLSEEELVEAWPRILKLRAALEQQTMQNPNSEAQKQQTSAQLSRAIT